MCRGWGRCRCIGRYEGWRRLGSSRKEMAETRMTKCPREFLVSDTVTCTLRITTSSERAGLLFQGQDLGIHGHQVRRRPICWLWRDHRRNREIRCQSNAERSLLRWGRYPVSPCASDRAAILRLRHGLPPGCHTEGNHGSRHHRHAHLRAQLKYLNLPLPSPSEQTAIVRFLDHADRRIRRYIRAKQKLMALLEEQKQAIIHLAVTGQIDVRTGRPYPAYKPSASSGWGRCRRIGTNAQQNGTSEKWMIVPRLARRNFYRYPTLPE